MGKKSTSKTKRQKLAKELISNAKNTKNSKKVNQSAKNQSAKNQSAKSQSTKIQSAKNQPAPKPVKSQADKPIKKAINIIAPTDGQVEFFPVSFTEATAAVQQLASSEERDISAFSFISSFVAALAILAIIVFCPKNAEDTDIPATGEDYYSSLVKEAQQIVETANKTTAAKASDASTKNANSSAKTSNTSAIAPTQSAANSAPAYYTVQNSTPEATSNHQTTTHQTIPSTTTTHQGTASSDLTDLPAVTTEEEDDGLTPLGPTAH